MRRGEIKSQRDELQIHRESSLLLGTRQQTDSVFVQQTVVLLVQPRTSGYLYCQKREREYLRKNRIAEHWCTYKATGDDAASSSAR